MQLKWTRDGQYSVAKGAQAEYRIAKWTTPNTGDRWQLSIKVNSTGRVTTGGAYGTMHATGAAVVRKRGETMTENQKNAVAAVLTALRSLEAQIGRTDLAWEQMEARDRVDLENRLKEKARAAILWAESAGMVGI
jgi:hypothetical protein